MLHPEWWSKEFEFHIQRNDAQPQDRSKVWSMRPTEESGWYTVETYRGNGHINGREYDKVKKEAMNHMFALKHHHDFKIGFRVIVVSARAELVGR